MVSNANFVRCKIYMYIECPRGHPYFVSEVSSQLLL